ncbi:MAG: NAD(+)/NADH kinase [Pseudomonadota bacterium]
MYPPRSVLVVTKQNTPHAAALGLQMCQWFGEYGVACRVMEGPASVLFSPSENTLPVSVGSAEDNLGAAFAKVNTADTSYSPCKAALLSECLHDVDLVFVLGGDGTMLGVSRKLIGVGIPIFGINLGNLGFLTSAPAVTWQQTLARIMSGDMQLSPRLALHFRIVRNGQCIASGGAVNDIVIHRGSLARVISLDVDIDAEHFITMRADGLIFSSPTGATGYSISARGPLLHPALDAYAMTPICPFLGNVPPMVLAPQSECRVRFLNDQDTVSLTVDGQDAYALIFGDEIVVTGMPAALNFGILGKSDYLGKLHSCGFVHDSRLAKKS